MHSLTHIKRPLVFLHNARCGGNKLNVIFMNQYQRKDWFKLGQNADGTISSNYEQLITDVKIEHRPLYIGHIVYGLHQYFTHPIQYISNVREPIARTLSLYTRWITQENAGTTLPNFLNQSFEADNGMVKRFAGIGEFNGQPFDFINNQPLSSVTVNDAIYTRAQQHVDEFIDDIIVLERLNATSILLEQKYALTPLFALTYNHMNQTGLNQKLSIESVPEQWHEWIVSHNSYDLKLYDYIKRYTDKRIHNLDAETKNSIRIRTLLTEGLTHSNEPYMTIGGFFNQLSLVLGKLKGFGLLDDLFEVCKLVIQHPELIIEHRQAFLQQIKAELTVEQSNQLTACLAAVDA